MNLKISNQADEAKHLFMDFENVAKKLAPCWFCGSKWDHLKLSHKGHCGREHQEGCPFKELGDAVYQGIVARRDSEAERSAAEKNLPEKIDDLFRAFKVKSGILPDHCPFPYCDYPFGDGLSHRLECPFSALRSARAR